MLIKNVLFGSKNMYYEYLTHQSMIFIKIEAYFLTKSYCIHFFVKIKNVQLNSK